MICPNPLTALVRLKRPVYTGLLLGAGLLAWLTGAAPAWAGIGTVTHVSGVLVVYRAGGDSRILAPDSQVEQGDVLASEAKSFARIRFNDGGNLLVRPNSRVTIERYSYDKDKPEGDDVLINLLKGGMRAITGAAGKRSQDKHLTTTPTATVGIRGTHYGLQQCKADCEGLTTSGGRPLEDGLHIDVLSGVIVARNDAGELQVSAGQFGFVRNKETPPELRPAELGFLASVPPSMSAPTGAGSTLGLESNDNICVIR